MGNTKIWDKFISNKSENRKNCHASFDYISAIKQNMFKRNHLNHEILSFKPLQNMSSFLRALDMRTKSRFGTKLEFFSIWMVQMRKSKQSITFGQFCGSKCIIVSRSNQRTNKCKDEWLKERRGKFEVINSRYGRHLNRNFSCIEVLCFVVWF